MQISIINGAVEFDGETVLSSVYFNLTEREKVALVGRNGCGKTTLLRALTGEVELLKGTGDEPLGFYVSGKPTIGYLKQVSFNDDNTLLDEVRSAYGELLVTEARLAAAEAALTANSDEKNIKEYAAQSERYAAQGGYTYKKEYLTAIAKFGFTEQDKSKPLSQFSGGQRTKIALLKLLLSKPDVLLLDEPTNHLDLSAIEWLEGYIRSCKNACVIVSHDRLFLDRTVSAVYEIEYGESKRYKGNYTAFTQQKRADYEKAVKDALYRKSEIQRLSKVVERFRYKKSKAAMAQAKLTQIKRIGEVGMPNRYDESTFHASFQPLQQTVKEVFTAEKLTFGYTTPLSEVSFSLKRGDKLGVIGANGTGKSTFVKTIMNYMPALHGDSRFGLHAQIGYFDQTRTQSAAQDSVLDDFLTEFPTLSNTQARTALGAFLLSGDDVFKKVCELSGGERVRYALCKILKRRPNVLVLDEPTNHMDVVGKETFEDMLKSYEGTVFLVSHDRYLINAVCNKLLVFEEGGASFYECGYEQYCAQKEEQQASAVTSSDDTAPIAPSKTAKNKPNTYLAQKEQAKLLRAKNSLESKITQYEAQKEQLTQRMLTPEAYADYQLLLDIQAQIEEIDVKLTQYLHEWEQLCAKLEEF